MSDHKARTGRMRGWLRLLLMLVAAMAAVFVLHTLKNSGVLEGTLQWLAGLGPWAPVAFIVLYVAAVLALLPASVLTLGAGILFGFFKGSLCVFAGAWGSSTLCFLIARHLARDWIARKLEHHPRFKALDEATAREGWKIVALVRLAPVFPFSITSYGFGLTRVPLSHYMLASAGMIPGTAAYIYFGTLIGDLAGVREGVSLPPLLKWTIGIVTVVVSLYVTRFARRALKQRL